MTAFTTAYFLASVTANVGKKIRLKKVRKREVVRETHLNYLIWMEDKQ